MLVRLLCPFLHHPHLPPEVLLAPSGRWLGLDSSSVSVLGTGLRRELSGVGLPRAPAWAEAPCAAGALACSAEASCAAGLARCQVPGREKACGVRGRPRPPHENRAPLGASRVPLLPLGKDRKKAEHPARGCKKPVGWKQHINFLLWVSRWYVWEISFWRHACQL